MEEFDIYKIYIRIKGGFTEYQGGVNFLNGKRKCPECLQKMIREPIGQPFVRVKGGCILVNTIGTTGRMLVSNAETNYHWMCTYCHNNIQVNVKPIAVPITEAPDENPIPI